MNTDLTPYPAYKDSDVEWLGKVPEHWEILPNRAVYEEVKERDHPEEMMLSVTITRGVIQQRTLLSDSNKKDSSKLDKSTYKFVRLGDLVYNKMRAWQGAIGVSAYQGIVSPAYVVECPRDEINSGYIHHLLRTPSFAAEAERWSYGITSDMWSLRPEHFKMIYGCIPPIDEQAAIALYLDHADRRIRRYIRAKERLIELLEEQKQAIIHQAVTGQIDVRTGQPYPAYKDSGVEWLGKVPVHWHVIALKRILDLLVDCEHKTAPAVDESEYRVVRTTAVRGGRLRWEGTYCTSKEAFLDWTKRTRPEPGDVIFTREAPVGESCVVPEGTPVCLGQRTVLMRPIRGEYDPDFLVHVIYTGPPRDQVRLASQGSTVGHFNMKDIGSLRVLKPPFDEQLRIKNEIGKQMYDLDLAVAHTVRQVSLLQEYRTRLIADVVTGKLDVRELAASLPEVEPLAAVEDTLDGSVRGIPEANSDKPNPSLA